MSDTQARIEWLQAVVAEIEELQRQNTTPQEELTELIKFQAEELRVQTLLQQQRKAHRKANSIGKKLSRSFKAASEAFNTEIEPDITDLTEE
ncbi:MAG: hypothetical protein DI610_04925 [Staphylococcus hominis]|nr:MAG: hypothetical protein DI610_04925 [Staphylococcus hominis]